jgi:hypothetical protein
MMVKGYISYECARFEADWQLIALEKCGKLTQHTYMTNDSRLDRFPCIKPYFKTTKTIECADVYYIRAEIVTRAPDESHCFSWLRLLEGSEAVRLVDHANPLANSLFKFYLSIF